MSQSVKMGLAGFLLDAFLMNTRTSGGRHFRQIMLILLLAGLAPEGFGEIIPADRRIEWQGNVGIPGGVPRRTQIHQTIPAGASRATIQSALDSCPSNRVVQLEEGTYPINGTLRIPSGVTLRGAGKGATILNLSGSSTAGIQFGSVVQGEYTATAHNIVSGYDKGSTRITLNNTSAISVGSLLVLDQLNDSSLPVSNVGTYGTITWNSRNNGNRAVGQTVEVTAINGSEVSFHPPMYWTYKSSLSPQAMSYKAGCEWAGVEDLTVRANNTGYTSNFYMPGSKYCWVKNVESDYADGDHAQIYWSFRCEVRDSYFHDGFKHTSGSTDCSITIAGKASGCLIENNVLYRMHTALILNWGASGNVVGYNYAADPFDSGSVNVQMYEFCGNHGAHPMFNLFEGNIGGQFHDDSYWGTSSHGTLFRNWATGDALIFPPYSGRGAWQTNNAHHATQGLRSINLDFGQSYYNVIGNIVGSPYRASHDVFRVVSPQNRSYQGTLYLFSLGYSDVSDSGSDSKGNARPFTTGIFHGNYDFVNATQMWDSSIPDQNLPNSLYLAGKPAWFGDLAWPPIDPARVSSAAVTNLPAGYYFVYRRFPPQDGVNQTPFAVAAGNPTTGLVPLTVSFSSAGSSDPEGEPLSYSWDFGDGTSSTAANPSKTFSAVGQYTVRLTVSDGENTSVSSPLTIQVNQPPNEPPVAQSSANPTSGLAPLAVSFSSVGSTDPEGRPLSYSWNFGDGSTSTQANPSKTFPAVGTFSVVLTVSDGQNAESAPPITITVASPDQNNPPTVSASAAPTSGSAPLSVNFSSAGSFDPEGHSLTYSWNFGDGESSSAANPSYTYTEEGTFTVRLTVSDGTNSVISSPVSITVRSLRTGLVAAYGFEEADGAAQDASGNGNHGTVSAATRVAGQLGKALSFNGVDSVVVVPDAPSLALTSAMTLEAWVNPSTLGNEVRNILYKDELAYFLVGAIPGNSRPGVGGSFTANPLFGPTQLPVNTWTHLAATFDGTVLVLYVNGNRVATQTVSGAILATDGPLMIGGNSLVSNRHWAGLIDEVRIYNRPLSQEEILASMEEPIHEAPRPPAAFRIVP